MNSVRKLVLIPSEDWARIMEGNKEAIMESPREIESSAPGKKIIVEKNELQHAPPPPPSPSPTPPPPSLGDGQEGMGEEGKDEGDEGVGEKVKEEVEDPRPRKKKKKWGPPGRRDPRGSKHKKKKKILKEKNRRKWIYV